MNIVVTPFEQILLNSKPRFLNDVLKRIRKRLKRRISYNINPEKTKARQKKYTLKHPKRLKERCRLYRFNNSEKEKKRGRKYYSNNKDKKKKYNQSEIGKKSNRISKWKRSGLISENYNLIYDRYLNTTNCDKCQCVLTYDNIMTSTTKCMDHSHSTGLFRNILCSACNTRRGENKF